MTQQYTYGYGYGYGYGTPASYMGMTPTPPAPMVTQATTPAAPAVGYSPYQTTPPAKPPVPPMPPAVSTMTSGYYQQQPSVANPHQQQAAAMAASYYGYQAAASSYPSYYPTPTQPPPVPKSSQPPPPTTPTSYKAPTYTPSPITKAQPHPPAPTTTVSSLVSYPTPTAHPPAPKAHPPGPSAYPPQPGLAQNEVKSFGRTSHPPPKKMTPVYSAPQVSQNLTPHQKQVVAQYVQSKTQPATTGSKPPAWWSKKSYGTGQEYYCEVCKISATCAATYKTHLEGKNHKKKVAQQKSVKTEDKKSSDFYCELCDIICSNADSLEAHNKGSKHQKVLNLHRRLGKPIPTLKFVESGAGDGKKMLAGSNKIMFVGGKTLKSTQEEGSTKTDEVKVYPPTAAVPQKKATPPTTATATATATVATDNKEKEEQPPKEVEPVGEHLVKEVKNDPKFPAAQYKCEMCDCYFNDDNAKKAHVKGRRHRLNYKKMYQPDLYVEPTSTQRKEMEKRKRMKEAHGDSRRGRGTGRGSFTREEGPVPEEGEDEGWDGGWDASMSPDPKHDPHDDILVLDRHKLVYPSHTEMRAIDKVVVDIEKALKTISDELMKEKAATVDGDPKDEAFRDLKGVMRVGAFAHNLLLKGECSVELVLMCDKKPTMTLFNLVVNRLALRFESLLKESENENVYNTTPLSDKGTVTIITQVGAYRIIVSVIFSSTLMRPEPSALQLQADQSEGVLNRQYCVAALAALRHTKWLKATSRDTPTSGIVLRVMKDICRRVPAWGVLESWMLELLVQKCALSSHPAYNQPGDLFRRVIECVASGIFLPGGRGLLDPCEKDPTDACAPLSAADRSNITLSAQHALRLIAFKKLHLVLSVDPLPGDEPEPVESKEPADGVAGTKRGPPPSEEEEADDAAKRAKVD